MNDKKMDTMKAKEFSKEFYVRLDYIYDMFISNNGCPEDFSTKCFSNGTNISYWLGYRLYILETIKDENKKAKYILTMLEKKKNKKIEETLNIFYKKLKEIYDYYLKTGAIPNRNQKVLFEDKTNMCSWFKNNIYKLYQIRNENKMADAILIQYEKINDMWKNFEDKLEEAYRYYTENNGLDNDEIILFSDGTSMNNWIKANKNKLFEIRDKNNMAYAILNAIELKKIEKRHKLFNKKAEEIYQYYLKTGDLLMEGEDAKFKSEHRYKKWLINAWNLETLKNMNKKVYKLALVQLLNESLLYNKNILEMYKYCITTNRIPNKEIDQKFSNGYSMKSWLEKNKYFIWKKRMLIHIVCS